MAEKLFRLSQFGVGLMSRYSNCKNSEDLTQLGKWTKEELCSMGPLYIKIGQFLSAREDLVCKEIVAELALLQDNTPKFHSDSKHLEAILPKPFRVSKSPLATASIAGVFYGEYDGKEAIFKIRRPGIKESFTDDLNLASNVLNILSVTQIKPFVAAKDILCECSPLLIAELDFKKEGRNLERFKKSLSDIEWIKVPRVYFNSDDVIVMEYVQSVKINDTKSLSEMEIDTVEVSIKLMTSFALQILRNGLFHGDPHPGNIGVRPNGSIVFYDLGVSLNVKQLRKHLVGITKAIAFQDVSGMITALQNSGIITSLKDRSSLRMIIVELFEYSKHTDPKKFHSSLINKKLVSGNKPTTFKLDGTFVYLMRSMSMVEGICKTLDPKFNYEDFLKILLPRINMQDANIVEGVFGVFRDMSYLPQTVRSMSETMEERYEMQKDSFHDMNIVMKMQSTFLILVILYMCLH